ncbi:hypothetical protein KKE28_01930 [Patescibacteria group bacterium]|nr:hypothetical protein [Patescibacteria group bacterium]
MEKAKRNGNGIEKTRIGFISRIDYPGTGFRRALLELARETFTAANVHFVVLAAGLVSSRAVKEFSTEIRRAVAAIRRQIKTLKKTNSTNEKRRKNASTGDSQRFIDARTAYTVAKNELKALPKDAPKEQHAELEAKVKQTEAEMKKRSSLRAANDGRRAKEREREEAEIESLQDEIVRKEAELEPYKPENMATYLADAIPRFTNATGERVKLYIVPSSAFDDDIGNETAEALQELRLDDIIVYSQHSNRFPISSAGKTVEVLVAEKLAWLRGDYYSTPVERILKDRAHMGDRDIVPDMFVVGGFGSAMTKPEGEWPTPWVSLPVLHDITGVRTSENQVGVVVVSIHPEHTVPLVDTLSFKDQVSRELEFIGAPREMNDRRRLLIAAMKQLRSASTGVLARETRLSEDEVTTEMQSMVPTASSARNTTWPGFVWDEKSRKWLIPHRWIQESLRYPSTSGERQVDSIVAYGCLHAGSVNLDMEFFLKEVPQRILDHGATILVGAGDFVEGINHDLIPRKEVYGGLVVTEQEILAGAMIASVTIDVFRARFPAALEQLQKKLGEHQPTDEELHAAISGALLLNLLIEGNHDEWVKRGGVIPLKTMYSELVIRVMRAVESDLDRHGLRTKGLYDLVRSKTLILPYGRHQLPSGLHLTVSHPHMSRTKTTSIRAQAALNQARGSQLAVMANFHVGIVVHQWNGTLGQRCCLQIGTMMVDTDFEHKKQKTVDHGFGFMKIVSVGGRVIETETSFYGRRPEDCTTLNPDTPLNDLLNAHGLNDNPTNTL